MELIGQRSGRNRWLALSAALATAAVLFIDVCDTIFACGCHSLWNGAAAACNIHSVGPPHCPWCQHPTAGVVAFFAVAAAQAAVVFWPGRLGLWARLGLAIAALPLVGGAVGLLQGWLWGYFLWPG